MRVGRFTSAGVAVVAMLGLVLTSCGGNKADAAEQSKVQCFTEMTPDQKAQLVEYTNQAPVSETSRPDGSQDVCVLKQNPDGSYSEQHSNGNDGFSDYLLYSLLLGNANGLAGFGLLTGDLNLGQAMALTLLTGVNNNGGLFHPYSYNQNTGWGRQPVVINNTRVTTIQYGNQPPRQYKNGKRPAPPRGYAKPKPLPKKSNKVANVTKDPSGKPTVTPVKKVNASKVLSGKQQLPANVKPTGPATTLARPTANNTQNTAKPSAPANQGTVKPPSNSPGTVKPPSANAPKPPAPKPPAPKPPAPKAPSAPRSGK